MLLLHYNNKWKNQMKDDVGMHNTKNHRNKSLHSKIIVQSCVTPEPELCREGLRMIVLLSCYEDSCSYDFSHCASLHHPSFDKMIFPLVPLIFFSRSSSTLYSCMQCRFIIPRAVTLLYAHAHAYARTHARTRTVLTNVAVSKSDTTLNGVRDFEIM